MVDQFVNDGAEFDRCPIVIPPHMLEVVESIEVV